MTMGVLSGTKAQRVSHGVCNSQALTQRYLRWLGLMQRTKWGCVLEILFMSTCSWLRNCVDTDDENSPPLAGLPVSTDDTRPRGFCFAAPGSAPPTANVARLPTGAPGAPVSTGGAGCKNVATMELLRCANANTSDEIVSLFRSKTVAFGEGGGVKGSVR